jgi:Cu-Zn family superoxide dismutase
MKTALRCLTPIIFLTVMVAGCGGDDSSAGGTAGSGGSGGAGGSGGSAGSGGGGEGDAGETKITSSTGDWNVYRDPYGDGGASPISETIKGSAEAFALAGGKMRVKLTVSGLPANRPFGSHIHKLACSDASKAGGHYQNMPFPDGGTATDPAYANNMNEVWLDFTTDATGAGSAEATVNWVPRAGEAKAVMIHDMPTATGGVAGAKLACIEMAF